MKSLVIVVWQGNVCPYRIPRIPACLRRHVLMAPQKVGQSLLSRMGSRMPFSQQAQKATPTPCSGPAINPFGVVTTFCKTIISGSIDCDTAWPDRTVCSIEMHRQASEGIRPLCARSTSARLPSTCRADRLQHTQKSPAVGIPLRPIRFLRSDRGLPCICGIAFFRHIWRCKLGSVPFLTFSLHLA